MAILDLIAGMGASRASRRAAAARLQSAVHVAIAKGYTVGKTVLIGNVEGRVIGYNIANGGDYPGATYPLVVNTPYGVSKCALIEVSLD